jgi:FkbM family methyltransferase
MTFTSYAQNFEDVLLWRALKHIKNGFYIDAGANDPEIHSVTKAFYERGWFGINIEPLPEFQQRFLDERPRDINLAVAAGARDGELTLFDVPSVRGWASPDQAVASAHEADGFAVVELTVPVRTLSGICRQHAPADIHFLKIDVEGFEGEVLRGMDFTQWRPWIVVVEATLPNSQVTNHAHWETLVTAHDYHFAYFDGLNRYYVAHEHRNLLDFLQIQPNVFDDFITIHLVKAWQARDAASEQMRQAEHRASIAAEQQWQAEMNRDAALVQTNEAQGQASLAQSETLAAQAAALEAQARTEVAETARLAAEADAQNAATDTAAALAWAHDLERQIVALYASRSWRLTQPIRWVTALYHQHMVLEPFLPRGWQALKLGVKQRSAKTVGWIVSREVLRRFFLPHLARMPAFNEKMDRMVSRLRDDPPPPPDNNEAQVPEHLRQLPASARKVLADLMRARGTHSGSTLPRS